MIVTFCGHYDFKENDEIKEKLLTILETEVGNSPVDFYLGGYGGFDRFARNVCKEYRKKYPDAKLYFVTPYLDPTYLKNREFVIKEYDGVISMNTEKTPQRLKILKRNYEMVKASDLVIAFVKREFGGASKTLQYAKQMKKKYVNIAK